MSTFMKLNTIWKKQLDFKRKRNNIPRRSITKISQRKLNLFVPLVELDVAILNLNSNVTLFYFFTEAYSFVFTFNTQFIYSVRVYKPDMLQINLVRRVRGNQVAHAHFFKYMHIFVSMFLLRVRMRGRLYRIYTRNIYRDLQYRFGRAHMVTVYVTGFYVKFIKKKFFRVFGYNFLQLPDKAYEIRSVFMQNCYTRRGVCIGGQTVRTRIGKAVKWY